jgi:hypothetical protein
MLPSAGLGFNVAVRAVLPVARSATVGKDDIVEILPGPLTLRIVRRIVREGPDEDEDEDDEVVVSAPVPNN